MRSEAPATLRDLLTPTRRLELARILGVGLVTLLFWLGRVPIAALLAAVAVGLCPLISRNRHTVYGQFENVQVETALR